MKEKTNDWQAPPFTVDAQKRYGWIEEQIQEGEGWLSGQTAYKNLGSNLRIFDGIVNDKIKSALISNELKYNLRKFVETISEVREIGKYSSDAVQFKAFAEMINKVSQGIYTESQFPRQIRKALQFAMLGRGYIWPKCKASEYGFGERRIVFEPLGMLDVVPTQIPATNDVQDAYANTIFVYMPIAEAHGRFPLYQSELIPVSAVSYQSRIAARRADYAEKFRYGDQARNWGNLCCEIRYTFIRDISINKTKSPIPMGDWGVDKDKKPIPLTSWSYEVPYIGQEIFAGIRNGQPYMRKAVLEDCRIYPFLRLMISSTGMDRPMYDGPAFDWHGVMPPVQYDVDDWAWEAMGRSLIQEVGSIEVTKRNLERKMDSVITTTLNPPVGYNRAEAGGPKIENFDIFEEDVRYGVDGEPKKVLQSLLPEEVRVIGEHFKFLEMLKAMEKEQLGINDLGNLAALKLNLSGENIDKALEPVGPIAKGIAAGMEAANAKIAYMLKFMVVQWYDTKRVIEYIGPDNITPEVYDFDPASMVPSHLPDEYVSNEVQGIQIPTVPSKPSAYKMIDRMRYLAQNIRLVHVPSTLLKMTQQAEQLKWMSLKFKNAPISWSTTLKKLGIDNYGEVPGNTEREKWVNEQIEDLKLKAAASQMAAELGLQPEPDKPGGGKGGRPPSGKKPMKQAQKGGAGGSPRVVNKES